MKVGLFAACSSSLFAVLIPPPCFPLTGQIKLTTYIRNYKIGQIVDIKGDGAVHKGMPHKFYHGKTGIVWNVTKRAIGVEVNKLVGHRMLRKRIHVRVEHVNHSKCRQDFLDRVQRNERVKREARAAGKTVPQTKRLPVQPKAGRFIKGDGVETLHALKFYALYTQ